MKLICAIPDCFYYPDDKSKNPEPDVPVKEDQKWKYDDENYCLDEKVGIIHDTSRLILFQILRV
jgi:Uma2 family endonuclease